jgi:hypothetical protein
VWKVDGLTSDFQWNTAVSLEASHAHILFKNVAFFG